MKKTFLSKNIVAGILLITMLASFSVDKSVSRGNKNANPVTIAKNHFTKAQAGTDAIALIFSPIDAAARLTISNNSFVFSTRDFITTYRRGSATGTFKIENIPSGVYDVLLEGWDPSYRFVKIVRVVVQDDFVTNLGSVIL